jgi:photosystem II stability/assembly factor-like uncharacterized protein
MTRVHRLTFICGALALLAACGGSDGDNGAPGRDGLTARILASSEPAGVHCASGGSRIDSGLDTDGSGVLDPSEVENTQYICHGGSSAAISSLVRMLDEPAGANCANGGKQVAVGPDSNGNGSLDDAEVSSTAYVCHGAPGAGGGNGTDGSNGMNSLMRIGAEPPGANCPIGGNKISSGLDSNRNGQLDPSEATSTSFICAAPANGPMPVVHVTTVEAQAEPNTRYLADNADEVTITLPLDAELGDVIQISGVGTGGWRIAQREGQTVQTINLSQPREVIGNVWTERAVIGNWQSLASSSDGNRLAAAAFGGNLFTSIDAGASWISAGPATQNKAWRSIASSADGQRLVAAEGGGHLHTSSDGGFNWTLRNGADIGREWQSVASSADGLRLAAVAFDDRIYVSDDAGVHWAPACDCVAQWRSVASSADGDRLVAVAEGGPIYTSDDGGLSWVAREAGTPRFWQAVAISADGSQMVAVVLGGRIYTSGDQGVTWTAREADRDWVSVASSADGKRLVASTFGGKLYSSANYGVHWTEREATRNWYPVASSADGMRLVSAEPGGSLFSSTLEPVSHASRTSLGAPGSVQGGRYDAIELQYNGGGSFIVLSASGTFEVR